MRKTKNIKKVLTQNYLNINNLHYIQKINVFYWKWYLNYFKFSNYKLTSYFLYNLNINKNIINYLIYNIFKNVFFVMYFNLLKQLYFINFLLIISLK